MVRAKNYETMSKFVKGMPRNTVASFFSAHGVWHMGMFRDVCLMWSFCILCILEIWPHMMVVSAVLYRRVMSEYENTIKNLIG